MPLPDARFAPDDVLLFGSEGAGVPDAVHDRADLRVAIPMRPGFRSLNVAVSAAMALGEALRQTRVADSLAGSERHEPAPPPAAQEYPDWAAGWGSGLVPSIRVSG